VFVGPVKHPGAANLWDLQRSANRLAVEGSADGIAYRLRSLDGVPAGVEEEGGRFWDLQHSHYRRGGMFKGVGSHASGYTLTNEGYLYENCSADLFVADTDC
jgi:hypothetical protein